MGTQASGTDVNLFFPSIYRYRCLLYVRPPLPLGMAHGMTNVIPELFGLAANITLHN